MEPVSYHSRVPESYDEILHRFGAKAVWDLACLDGVLPLLCVQLGIPYVGVTQGEYHKTTLLSHLHSSIFRCFMREDSPIYKPDLAVTMSDLGADDGDDDNKPNTPKPKPKPKPKSTSKKPNKDTRKPKPKPKSKPGTKPPGAINAAAEEAEEEEEDPEDEEEEDEEESQDSQS